MKTLAILIGLVIFAGALAAPAADAQEQQAEFLTDIDGSPAGSGDASALAENADGNDEARHRAPAGQHDLYSPAAWPEAPDAAGMLKRLALGTCLVLGLCCTTLWMGKRWLSRSPLNKTGNQQLRVTESISLGNRCFVALVQAGPHQVLAGLD